MTQAGRLLDAAITAHEQQLRPAEHVMAPAALGAARLTRYSFSRTMLRRAWTDQWRVQCVHFEMDDVGRGEAIYEVFADAWRFHFVAFTTTLDEAVHTDRVVGERWEISAALVEGEVTAARLAMLRHEVPRQERGRLDADVLVLTRGNRSVRFFQYVIDCLARGDQPDPDRVGDAGYLMRSTAFYGNGKYGMRSFEGYPPDHPLGVPYRAQMLAAWIYRELSYDVVEHCARRAGGEAAVPLGDGWRCFFGLGNATGLGLVPYAYKHPHVIHAWVAIRELALSAVRDMAPTATRLALLDAQLDRARTFFSTGTHEDCAPFLSPAQLVAVVDEIERALERVSGSSRAFDELYEWAHTRHAELSELVVSLLIELHDANDHHIDEMLRVDETVAIEPSMTVGQLIGLLDARFEWIKELDLDNAGADHYWWLISDNTEEPRRAPRDRLDPAGRDVSIDIALTVNRLRAELAQADPDELLTNFLQAKPAHVGAAHRVVASDAMFGEPRDNACSAEFLPLQLQRFQLAMYGMDNFKPKSTDWLRVTLFQGAPRCADLADTNPTPGFDDWIMPSRPRNTS